MATAPLSFTKHHNGRQAVGSAWNVSGYIYASDDGDYVAAGIPVTAALFGLTRLDNVRVHGMWADGAGTAPATVSTLFEGAYYDKTAKKIQMATSAADGDPLDEGNTATISGYTLDVTAVGV